MKHVMLLKIDTFQITSSLDISPSRGQVALIQFGDANYKNDKQVSNNLDTAFEEIFLMWFKTFMNF